MTKELKFLIKIVKKSSKKIEANYDIERKEDSVLDIVTTNDYKVERYLISEIEKHYPNFNIVSEEYNKNNKLTENCFTIDPIDGTINFANNIPLWCIQVACIKGGKTVAAVIYFPKLKEMYSADINGAYLNNRKISVNNLLFKNNIFTATGKDHMQANIQIGGDHTYQRSFYCAGLDFSYVASGKIGGTVFTNNTLWDYVPGMFICQQAGAKTHSTNGMHIAANSQENLNMLLNKLSDEKENVQ